MSDHIEQARHAAESIRILNDEPRLSDSERDRSKRIICSPLVCYEGVEQLLATIDAQAAEIADLRKKFGYACRIGLSALRDEAERSKRIEAQRDAQDAEITALEDLVSHCWVHRDYCDCGYEQMTTEQRQLHDAAITHSNKRAGIE